MTLYLIDVGLSFVEGSFDKLSRHCFTDKVLIDCYEKNIGSNWFIHALFSNRYGAASHLDLVSRRL